MKDLLNVFASATAGPSSQLAGLGRYSCRLGISVRNVKDNETGGQWEFFPYFAGPKRQLCRLNANTPNLDFITTRMKK